MKTSLIFALVATAGAAKAQQGDAQSQGSQTQGAQTQGAQTQGAQSSGYEAPAQESYAAPTQSYSAPSYEAAAAPAYVSAPKCCAHECPSHAPFFSTAQCGCVAGVVYSQPAYSGYEAQSYEQPSYSQGGQGQQSGYRFLQDVGRAPGGTIDMRDQQLTSSGRICLWIGFVILFLSGWSFINRALKYHFLGDDEDLNRRQLAFVSGPAMIAGFVCLIAALAYLTMATGNGFYTRCSDGRQFYFARYIDWVLTTPLMLHGLVHFAAGSDDTFIYLFFMDVLMIVAGLIASVVETGHKWFFFAFSMLCFLPVIYYICDLRSRAVDTRFDYALFFWNYNCMANLTAIAWFCYPIVWILAEGTGTLSADGEAIIYTVLDIIAKALLGLLIISSKSIYSPIGGGLFEPTALAEALIAANIALE